MSVLGAETGAVEAAGTGLADRAGEIDALAEQAARALHQAGASAASGTVTLAAAEAARAWRTALQDTARAGDLLARATRLAAFGYAAAEARASGVFVRAPRVAP